MIVTHELRRSYLHTFMLIDREMDGHTSEASSTSWDTDWTKAYDRYGCTATALIKTLPAAGTDQTTNRLSKNYV